MAAYVSIWKDTVAHVDVIRLSLEIPERSRVVYIRLAITRPWTRLVPFGENLIMTDITASRTAGKSSSQSANILELDSSRSIPFGRTGETPHGPPDEMLPATSETTEHRCRRDCVLALNARVVLQRM